MEQKIKVIKHFTYRSVMGVYGTESLTIPREQMRGLEKYLADSHSCSMDNHTCYIVEGLESHHQPKVFAIMFSDNDCTIGTRIAKGDCENHDCTKYIPCLLVEGDFVEKKPIFGSMLHVMETNDHYNQKKRIDAYREKTTIIVGS